MSPSNCYDIDNNIFYENRRIRRTRVVLDSDFQADSTLTYLAIQVTQL